MKIGKAKDPIERARALQTTGVPTPFKVAWRSSWLADPGKAETQLHERLAQYRETSVREFFRMSAGAAIREAKAVVELFVDRATDSEGRPSDRRRRVTYLLERLEAHYTSDGSFMCQVLKDGEQAGTLRVQNEEHFQWLKSQIDGEFDPEMEL